jgi:hypothetical protein
MDNGKVFTREVQIRFDASGHDGSDVHFNIDMITRLEGYPKTYSHKEELHFVVQDKLPHYYFMKLYDPGLRRPPFYIGVCWGFQFKEDREYSEKQDEFIRKLRARELTPEYEKWYKDNVFDPAATRYQERKRNNSPLKPKDITKD